LSNVESALSGAGRRGSDEEKVALLAEIEVGGVRPGCSAALEYAFGSRRLIRLPQPSDAPMRPDSFWSSRRSLGLWLELWRGAGAGVGDHLPGYEFADAIYRMAIGDFARISRR
jgi:hypothetical protein